MQIKERSKLPISLDYFHTANSPLFVRELDLTPPDEHQRIRSMLVLDRRVSDGFLLPDFARWTLPLLEAAAGFQASEIGHELPYAYLTIRSGPVITRTDDVWHTDGFSMKVPCRPQLTYFWSDCFPTEFTELAFTVPSDFDPMRHNLFRYIHNILPPSHPTYAVRERCVYVIDPYVIHRRQPAAAGQMRTFVRIVYSDILIPDVNLTQNPLLPTVNNHDGVSFRNSLEDYHSHEPVH